MNLRLPLILAVSAACGIASASVVNIDFNTAGADTFTGLAAAPDAAGASAVWNPLVNVSGTASSVALNDSAGAVTGIGFELTGITASINNATTGEQELAGGFINLMRDYVRIASGSSNNVVTTSGKFTGLTTGASYEIYFYGQGENFGGGNISGGSNTQGQNSLFTVGANSAQTGWDGVNGGNGILAEGIEWVKLTGIADGSGEISFDWANVVAGSNVVTDNAESTAASGTKASQYGVLNGIQLVEVVPEPSTILMSALGMLGLVVRRRR